MGQEPSSQARQVYSSNTNSFSLQGVHVQQQLTSPLRITWKGQNVCVCVCVHSQTQKTKTMCGSTTYCDIKALCTPLCSTPKPCVSPSYLNLSFITGFTADRLDDCIFVGPNFIIIYLQASVVPAANVNVVVVVLPHLFEIHDFIPVDEGRTPDEHASDATLNATQEGHPRGGRTCPASLRSHQIKSPPLTRL